MDRNPYYAPALDCAADTNLMDEAVLYFMDRHREDPVKALASLVQRGMARYLRVEAERIEAAARDAEF